MPTPAATCALGRALDGDRARRPLPRFGLPCGLAPCRLPVGTWLLFPPAFWR